jgi:hypothetical protein
MTSFEKVNHYRLDILHSVCVVLKRTPEGDIRESFRFGDTETLREAIHKVCAKLDMKEGELK